MVRQLPSGTVTFLHELGAQAYADALAEHRRALREAFSRHGGVEVDTQGDAFFVAFPTAPGALAAVRQSLAALASGPIRVRMGLHTGTPHVTTDGYVGADVHRAARIAAAGHGGQVLLSKETRELLEDAFVDLGEHRLKDFAAAVPIFQLGAEAFPPLKTISNTNLPRPASSFVGRETEIGEITALLRDGVRMLTLTGPGGSGKTRLAIEAATALVPSFKAGVFWVGLAPLRDPTLVPEAIAQTLGAKNGLADHIGERQLLLLTDNLEQVASAAGELATLVERCPNLRVLATSREVLRVRGEREYAVAPLADPDAIALFCDRAGTEPDATIRELCRALDNLPLAVELAASRASVLTPRQMLERISTWLDLLKGGRDVDPRQRTLRATIEWSHELLSHEEQALFARISVFAGGCTLEAAETVADADLDTLQSLVDKSLVRHTEERFWMLESIRSYAAERLGEADDRDSVRGRHATHFLELAERLDAAMRAGDPEEGPVSGLELEINNLRTAVDFGLETGDSPLVRQITTAVPMYWMVRGLYVEGRSWLERALALDETRDETRRRLLSALGMLAYAQGDRRAAVKASDEAALLASDLGGETERIALLGDQAFAALQKGDFATAEGLYRERLGVAIAVDNGVATSSCRLNLAYIAMKTRRLETAEALLAENLPFVRSRGQARCEATTLASLAETNLYRDRHQECGDDALLGAIRALQIRDNPLAVYCLELLAASTAAQGDLERAATILGATDAARETMGVGPDEDEAAIRAKTLEWLGSEPEPFAEAWEQGRHLDLPRALEIAKADPTGRATSAEPPSASAL